MCEKIFYFILDAAVTAGIAAAAVIIARLFLRRAPKKWAYMMWAVVFFRCLCPFSAESGFSLFNAFEGIFSANKASVSEALPTEGGVNVPISFDADNAPAEIIFVPEKGEIAKSAAGVPQTQPEKKSAQVYTILLAVWACGAAAMALYGVIASLSLKRRIKTAVKTEDGVFESDRIATAFTAGLFRPRIYLPCGLPPEQGELIILHERVHIRRRDYILKPLAFAGLAVQWFDPLIWAAFALMTRDMEMSCDEAVLRICGTDKRTAYSEALLNASVRGSGIAAWTGFGESAIKERVKNVLDYKKPKLWATALAAAVMLTACGTVGTDAKTEETGSSAADDALKVELNDGSTVTTLKVEQNDGSTVTTSAPKEEDGDGSNIYIDKDGNAISYGSGEDNEEEYVPKIVFDEVTGKVKYMESHPALSETGGDEAEDSKAYLYFNFGETGGELSELSSEERAELEAQRLREEEEAKRTQLFEEWARQDEVRKQLDEQLDAVIVTYTEYQREYQKFKEDIKSSYSKIKKPVDSPIIDPYGESDGVGMDGSSFHKGVDFKVKEGDTVCAADGGKVIAASDKGNGYGMCVIIDHGNGMATLYAHLSKASVSVDDEVEQGDEIGKAGHTGAIYGDGLHFEVRIDGQHVDPMDYLDN